MDRWPVSPPSFSACGLTHVADLATLWVPVYGLQGLLKAGTAIISVTTAVAALAIAAAALALPSPAAAAEPATTIWVPRWLAAQRQKARSR